jgi:hypothetical protein
MNHQLTFDTPEHDGPYEDDSADAPDRMLEVISAVDFLRRGDRRNLTLWGAIEEALRWWIDERLSLVEGVQDPEINGPRVGDPDLLRDTLTRFVTAAGVDEPVHVSVALQQALRRWGATMSTMHTDGEPWPHPIPHK